MSSFDSHSQEKENGNGPILCVNNCGFFGCSETMNLCSVCYKDFVKKQKAEEESSSTATSAVELLKENEGQSGSSSETASGAEGGGKRERGGEENKPKPNRCSSCKKRVGLTGFECRCGDTFCGVHRYAEQHNCPYDYRKAAREVIAKNNPLIKADKLQKF